MSIHRNLASSIVCVVVLLALTAPSAHAGGGVGSIPWQVAAHPGVEVSKQPQFAAQTSPGASSPSTPAAAAAAAATGSGPIVGRILVLLPFRGMFGHGLAVLIEVRSHDVRVRLLRFGPGGTVKGGSGSIPPMIDDGRMQGFKK